jgi:hypothetical protein
MKTIKVNPAKTKLQVITDETILCEYTFKTPMEMQEKIGRAITDLIEIAFDKDEVVEINFNGYSRNCMAELLALPREYKFRN